MENYERITKEEISCLRNLAMEVREIAKDPKWAEKIKLWRMMNDMQPGGRTMVMFPPECWHELIPASTLVCKDPLFRKIELELRQRVMRGRYFNDDIILTDILYIPYVFTMTDWVENRARPYDERPDHSGAFHPCIIETSDFEKKMRFPDIEVDREKSAENFKLVKEILGDLLTVVEGAPFQADHFTSVMGNGVSMIDIWVELRGLEQVMYDLYEEPEFTHEVMSFFVEGEKKFWKKNFDEGIWLPNNNGYMPLAANSATTAAGTNGMTYTSELPEKVEGKVQPKDLWVWAMAQDFTGVSPEMLAEFVLPYQAQLTKEFGLVGYGCCENIDKKYDVIKAAISNVRQFAVSAFSSIDTAVEKIGGDFVMSWKVNPANVFMSYDEDRIRKELEHGLSIAKGMPCVLALREAQTVNGHLERGFKWCDIAMELVEKYR